MNINEEFVQYATVRLKAIRNDRFLNQSISYLRHPQIGDIGVIVEIYTTPNIAYEVECSQSNGETVWLEALFPDEIELFDVFEKIQNV